jgi:hypothetical protein
MISHSCHVSVLLYIHTFKALAIEPDYMQESNTPMAMSER